MSICPLKFTRYNWYHEIKRIITGMGSFTDALFSILCHRLSREMFPERYLIYCVFHANIACRKIRWQLASPALSLEWCGISWYNWMTIPPSFAIHDNVCWYLITGYSTSASLNEPGYIFIDAILEHLLYDKFQTDDNRWHTCGSIV